MSAITEILDQLKQEYRFRMIPADRESSKWLDLSSNDYMALASRRKEFMEEFFDRFGDASFTSSASRLLSLHQNYHLELENYLENLYKHPALLFNSGYHANVGCVGAFSSLPSTLFVCDKLIHASIVDGLRIAGAEFKRFPHNNISKLRIILEKESSKYQNIVIVTESIFSMDGDEAPLKSLVDLKREFKNTYLYVDEAHAFGVRGESGLGLAEELRLINDVDILIGTFGKAAASAGAFVISTPEIKDLLINTARPFIFSTALPPVNVAWSRLMTEKIIGMHKERRHLREVSSRFEKRLSEISGKHTGSDSQIVPWLTRDADKALSTASILKESGIIALPIRRPTVPPGGERIRFSLSADMSEEILNPVVKILETTI